LSQVKVVEELVSKEALFGDEEEQGSGESGTETKPKRKSSKKA
jgi:hypothetical protein